MSERRLGFSEVVGHDDLKLALVLAAVDPAVGGVLLRGDKGAGKTTLARGLASLLPGDAPFVDLPVGATEDRVLGSIDLATALTSGHERVRRGLLADADGGVLYVDEVNLLADHLVDALLDVAVSGEHRLERDGVSVVQPARFVLVGTMNPEEGELRPQLLDRFGLCVTVHAPDDPDVRAEIVRRRLGADRPPRAGDASPAVDDDAALRDRLADTTPAALDEGTIAFATRLALAVGAEGMRADLVLCRAAAALAGWEGRRVVTVEDVERVAPLALAHRRRRSPFDPPTLQPDELDDAVAEARDQQDPRGAPEGGEGNRAAGSTDADGSETGSDTGGPGRAEGADADAVPPAGAGGTTADDGAGPPLGTDSTAGTDGDGDGDDPGLPGRPAELGGERRAPALPGTAPGARPPPGPVASGGRRGAGDPVPAVGARGREIRDEPFDAAGSGRLAVTASVRRFARRRAADAEAVPERRDLRASVRREQAGTLLVVALDTSGSMGARARVRAATGAVLGLLTDAYQRRDRVAVVTFDGSGASVALAPTSSVEVARTRLAALHTGGTTPLADGLRAGLEVARRHGGPAGAGGRAVLVVVTDGRATGDGDAVAEALAAAESVRAAGVAALVLDAETGTPRLGLAPRVAEAMGAACRPIAELTAGTLHQLAATGR